MRPGNRAARPGGPQFFCEACGTEVSAGAITCPRCGKAFTAVRCPRCRFEGSVSDFSSGCPSCGYMEPPKPGKVPPPRQAHRTWRLPRGFYRLALLGLAVIALGLLAVLLFAT